MGFHNNHNNELLSNNPLDIEHMFCYNDFSE
jgi:hypothetical protein